MNIIHARIAIACAFGALLGSFVSLHLLPWLGAPTFLWPLGAVLGGVIAYFAYEPTQVRVGIARAYVKTVAWKPDVLYWKVFGGGALWAILLVQNIFGAILAMILLTGNKPGALAFVRDLLIVDPITCLLSAPVLGYMAASAFKQDEQMWEEIFFDGRASFLKYLLPLSPSFWLYSAIRNIPHGVNALARFMWKFAREVLIFIHSEARTTCFTGGLAGAAVGYIFGNPLAGLIAGPLVGLMSYELVGKRILKVVPISK